MSRPPLPDPGHWPAVRHWFEQALAWPAAEREPRLQAAEVDAAVRAEVLSLLAHEPAAVSASGDAAFLEASAGRLLAAALAEPPAAGPVLPPGLRLGAWEVVGPLGSGGMAEVLRARRADGAWEGEAAVKVLKRGMDSEAVLARFAQEQRALARLAHPHIARLLDAGRGPSGLPYFVMELIDGQPIDQACQGLPLDQRLAMFLQLADAVAFAHRQLLVHRDLKPSNVMVTTEGQVKLLDFGIAKALDPTEGADAGHTAAGQRPFTPNFASPEQVRGEPVGTGTDIYSLGVLLYVMLTGQRPYGRQATTPQDAMRSVLEEQPTRPSALTPGLVADPLWLQTRKRLQGDLDNILLKALDKAPERRYASVDALAADLRAHQAGYPVSARPPRPGYLLGRFVRRNAWGVSLAALALLAVLSGAGLALWQARVADVQRAAAEQRFKQLRQLANQLVFKYHDQIENLPGATRAREALLMDAAAFLDSLDQVARDDPQLADELANTYYRISRLQGVDLSINTGQHAQAEVNLDKALALSQRYVGRPDVSIQALTKAIDMQVSKAELWQRRGRMAEADGALQHALPLLARALQRDPTDTWALASAINLHGVRARLLGTNLAAASLGRWREACDSADRARAAADATLKADPANAYAPDSLAFTLGEQAQCRTQRLQLDDAAALFRQQLALRDQMAARFPDDMDFRYQRAVARGHLARVLALQGQPVQARQTLDTAMALAREAVKADPGNQAGPQRLRMLALTGVQLQVLAGQGAGARAAAEVVLAHLPPAAPDNFTDLRERAESLLWAARAWRAERPARALALATEAAQFMAAPRADDDNSTRRWLLAQALGEQALALAQQGRHREAAAPASAALAQWAMAPPGDGPPPMLAAWRDALQPLAKP
jgi:hypothetical protein